MVFVGPDRKKDGQKYVNPLFTLTGKEYAEANFIDLFARISKVLFEKFYSKGEKP